jgi:hypothetical protein
VQLKITASQLQKWDYSQKSWKIYPVGWSILMGNSSMDVKVKATVTNNPKH